MRLLTWRALSTRPYARALLRLPFGSNSGGDLSAYHWRGLQASVLVCGRAPPHPATHISLDHPLLRRVVHREHSGCGAGSADASTRGAPNCHLSKGALCKPTTPHVVLRPAILYNEPGVSPPPLRYISATQT